MSRRPAPATVRRALALGRVAAVGALACSRHRRARRAALRGAVAASFATASTRAVAVAWGTAAPPRVPDAVDLALGLGAALELRRAGPVVAGAATATAGAGLLAAVLAPAGAAGRSRWAVVDLAVAVASVVATTRLWAVPPGEVRGLPAARLPHRRSAGPGGGGLTVVVNPAAGRARPDDPGVTAAGATHGTEPDGLEELRAALPDAAVVVGTPDALTEALEVAAGRGPIGVVGGDGTIRAAAEVALAHRVPLAVIPGGTLNHFARDSGIEDVSSAAAAVRGGEVAEVDVGRIDGSAFLNTASFGAYAALVDARRRLEPSIGKFPAMAVGLLQVLRHGRPVEVAIDGRARRLWLIFIGNCRYQPAGLAPGWREDLRDGWLDVRWVDAERRWSRARLVAAVLTGQLGRSGVYERRLVRRLAVRHLGDGPLRLACDGETFDASGPTFTVDKAPEPLLVYTPAADRPPTAVPVAAVAEAVVAPGRDDGAPPGSGEPATRRASCAVTAGR